MRSYLLQLVLGTLLGALLAAVTSLIAYHMGEPSAVWVWEKLTIIMQVIRCGSGAPILPEEVRELDVAENVWDAAVELQERAKYAQEVREKSKYSKRLREQLGIDWVVDSISVRGA